MRSMVKIRCLVSIVILCAIIAPVSSANDISGYKGTFNLKFGYYGGGTMTVDNSEYNTDDGLCFGGGLDFPATRDFYIGVTFDAAQIVLWSKSEYLLNAGLLLKKRFSMNEGRVLFRPAVGIGYAMINEVLWVDESSYLTLQVFNEMVLVASDRFGMLWDIGLFWALSGGNDEHDISGGPFLMMRFGLSM